MQHISGADFMQPLPPPPPLQPTALRQPDDFDDAGPVRDAQYAEIEYKQEQEGIRKIDIRGSRCQGLTAYAEIAHLMHGCQICVGEFRAIFRSWEDVKPFEAKYIIRAANLPEATTGKINFIVSLKSEGTTRAKNGGGDKVNE
ncbi:MAG: hypothetical protein ACOC8H_01225 [bacterium]